MKILSDLLLGIAYHEGHHLATARAVAAIEIFARGLKNRAFQRIRIFNEEGNKMKTIRSIKTSIAALVLVIAGFQLSIQPAQAFVPFGQVAGVVLIAASSTFPIVGIPVGCAAAAADVNRNGYTAWSSLGCLFGAIGGFVIGALIGSFGIIGGIFLLDDPQNAATQLEREPFPALSPDGIKTLGLTPQEALSYQQERDVINALAQAHSQEIQTWVQALGENSSVPTSAPFEKGAELWAQDVREGLISTSARRAMEKVGQLFSDRISKASHTQVGAGG